MGDSLESLDEILKKSQGNRGVHGKEKEDRRYMAH